MPSYQCQVCKKQHPNQPKAAACCSQGKPIPAEEVKNIVTAGELGIDTTKSGEELQPILDSSEEDDEIFPEEDLPETTEEY